MPLKGTCFDYCSHDCSQCLSRVMVKNTHGQQRASHLNTHGHQCHHLNISRPNSTVSRSLPPSSWIKTKNPIECDRRILECGLNMKETHTNQKRIFTTTCPVQSDSIHLPGFMPSNIDTNRTSLESLFARSIANLRAFAWPVIFERAFIMPSPPSPVRSPM